MSEPSDIEINSRKLSARAWCFTEDGDPIDPDMVRQFDEFSQVVDAKLSALRAELAAAKLSLWQYTRPSGYDVNGRTYGEGFGCCSHSVLLFRDCERCDAGSGRPRPAKVVA